MARDYKNDRENMLSSINNIYNNPILKEMSRRLRKIGIMNNKDNEGNFKPSLYKYIFIEELYKINNDINNNVISIITTDCNFNNLILKLSENKFDPDKFSKLVSNSKYINMLKKEYLLDDIKSIISYVMEKINEEILEQI